MAVNVHLGSGGSYQFQNWPLTIENPLQHVVPIQVDEDNGRANAGIGEVRVNKRREDLNANGEVRPDTRYRIQELSPGRYIFIPAD